MEYVSSKVLELGTLYAEDLPNPNSQSELHSWYIKWKVHEKECGFSSLPTSPYHTLPRLSSMYPNIKILTTVLCTLPVTSCTAERSFSRLKRIKAPLRSTMGNDRLSLLHMHRDIDINIPEVIDEFARRHPCRLKLANILS